MSEANQVLLPSTFTVRKRQIKGPKPENLSDFEEFNHLGVFTRQNEEESPTEVKMKRTALLLNQNKSFDLYFAEMRRRNQSKGLQTSQNVTVMMNSTEKSIKIDETISTGLGSTNVQLNPKF